MHSTFHFSTYGRLKRAENLKGLTWVQQLFLTISAGKQLQHLLPRHFTLCFLFTCFPPDSDGDGRDGDDDNDDDDIVDYLFMDIYIDYLAWI